MDTVIKTVINYAIPLILGYCINLIRNYRKRIKEKEAEGELLKVALMTMIQSTLTNTYFVYNEMKQIPDYIYRNWNNLFKIYKKLDGNDYCDTLKKKMDGWEIVKTDILER